MLAFFFNIAIVYWGWQMLIRFRPCRNGYVLICGAYLLGVLISTWLALIISLILGVLYPGTIFIIAISLLGHGFFLHRKQKFRIIWKLDWILIALWFIIVVPFFLFGCWPDSQGNLCILGNYDDLPFHWAMVSHFVEQPYFTLYTPQSAGHKLVYHFLINLHTALLIKGGWSYWFAIVANQVAVATCLIIFLYYLARSILMRFSSSIIAIIFLLFAHIGLANILVAIFGKSVGDQHIPKSIIPWSEIFVNWSNITLFYYFNFVDPIINLFHPQRPFLIGFPLFCFALLIARSGWLLKERGYSRLTLAAFIIALMPLFHLHSCIFACLIVFFVTIIIHFRYKINIICLWPFFFIIPQFLYLVISQKPDYYSGFDVANHPCFRDLIVTNIAFFDRIIYWFRVGSISAILGLPALIILGYKLKSKYKSQFSTNIIIILIGGIVGLSFWVLINFYRFTPNWGDSNKFYFYFCVFATLAIGYFFGKLWKKHKIYRIIIITFLSVFALLPFSLEYLVLFTKPILSLMRSAIVDTSLTKEIFPKCFPYKFSNRFANYRTIFSTGDLFIGQWLKNNLPHDAVLATTDDIIHFAVPLSGLSVVDGAYTWANGFCQNNIKNKIKVAYNNRDFNLFSQIGVTHILVGPREKCKYNINSIYWPSTSLLDVVYLGCRYQIFDIKKIQNNEVYSVQYNKQSYEFNSNTVPLTSLTPISTSQECGEITINKSLFSNKPIMIGYQKFNNAIATHAYSCIIYNLNKKYQKFKTVVAINDSEFGSEGSVIFSLYCDNQLVWESKLINADGKLQKIEIPLVGVKELKLEVTDGGNGNHNDHAVWGMPILFLVNKNKIKNDY